MVHIKVGDLVKSDCDVMAHQTNCQGAMNSGVARSLRDEYPWCYDEFKRDVRTPDDKLGTCLMCERTKDDPIIFHMYGQLRYGRDGKRYTDYVALGEAIDLMMETVVQTEKEKGIQLKVGLPYKIGCGLGGGTWGIVLDIISSVSKKHNHDIYLYNKII